MDQAGARLFGSHPETPLRFRKIDIWAGRWWHMPFIPALGRERQADLCEFKASLVYKS